VRSRFTSCLDLVFWALVMRSLIPCEFFCHGNPSFSPHTLRELARGHTAFFAQGSTWALPMHSRCRETHFVFIQSRFAPLTPSVIVNRVSQRILEVDLARALLGYRFERV